MGSCAIISENAPVEEKDSSDEPEKRRNKTIQPSIHAYPSIEDVLRKKKNKKLRNSAQAAPGKH